MKSIRCQCGKLMQIDSNRAVARKRCDLLFSLFCDQFYRTLAELCKCLKVSDCFNCDTSSEFLYCSMDKQGIERPGVICSCSDSCRTTNPKARVGRSSKKGHKIKPGANKNTSGHQRLSQVDFGVTIDLPCFLQEAQSGTKHSAVANLGQHLDS